MISWWWLIVALVAGCILGIVGLAICVAGGQADDWHDGYRQGRKDAMTAKWALQVSWAADRWHDGQG